MVLAASPEAKPVAGASFRTDEFAFTRHVVAPSDPGERVLPFELDLGPGTWDAGSRAVLEDGLHISSFVVNGKDMGAGAPCLALGEVAHLEPVLIGSVPGSGCAVSHVPDAGNRSGDDGWRRGRDCHAHLRLNLAQPSLDVGAVGGIQARVLKRRLEAKADRPKVRKGLCRVVHRALLVRVIRATNF